MKFELNFHWGSYKPLKFIDSINNNKDFQNKANSKKVKYEWYINPKYNLKMSKPF